MKANLSRRTVWTPERLQELRKYCELGFKVKMIAKRMNQPETMYEKADFPPRFSLENISDSVLI